MLLEFLSLAVDATNPAFTAEQRTQALRDATRIVDKEREKGRFDSESLRNSLQELANEIAERPLERVHEETVSSVQKDKEEWKLFLSTTEQALDRLDEEDIRQAPKRKEEYERIYEEQQKAERQQQKTERLLALHNKSLLTKIGEVELTWTVLVIDVVIVLIWLASGFVFVTIMVLFLGFIWLPYIHIQNLHIQVGEQFGL